MKNYSDLNDYEIIYMISEDDEIAKDIMFRKYEPVIRKEALKYLDKAMKLGLDMDDLIQEGYIAISSSLKNFDSDRGILFFTYVKTAISRKIANLIRVSSGDKYKILNDTVSLDANVTDDANLFSFVEDKNAIEPLTYLESKSFSNRIKKILYGFEIEDASILELKINGFKRYEIAELLSIPISNVGRIWSKIKRNLNLIIEN